MDPPPSPSSDKKSLLGALSVQQDDESLLQIIALAGDPDPRVREDAAIALGMRQRSEVIPELIRMAGEDPDEGVKVRATQALGEYYRAPEIGSLLLEEARGENPSRWLRFLVAEQLRHYPGDASVAALKSLFENDDTDFVRHSALDSLSCFNRPGMEGFWFRVLSRAGDGTFERETAEKALRELGISGVG